MWQTFLSDEAGAVTVDWVVLTAAVVGLGLATGAVVATGVGDLSNQTADAVEDIDPGQAWFGRAGTMVASAFDNGFTRDGQWSRSAPDGWSVTTGGTYRPTDRAMPGRAGDTVMHINRGGVATYDTGEGFFPTASYSLSMDVGDRADCCGTANYTASIYAGDTLIGTTSGSTSNGTMNNVSFNTEAGDPSLAGEPVSVRITNHDGQQIAVDNVSLTAEY